jgi:hypothetical protein
LECLGIDSDEGIYFQKVYTRFGFTRNDLRNVSPLSGGVYKEEVAGRRNQYRDSRRLEVIHAGRDQLREQNKPVR